MTACLTLRFATRRAVAERRIVLNNLVIAGWTGRDAAAVEQHIRELEDIGVARPKAIPSFYDASPDLVTTAEEIRVAGDDTSGEAEAVILMLDDGLWVGLGSDHTDRALEMEDVALSKQACAKPVSPMFWLYEELAGHWDRLALSSSITLDDGERVYQTGNLVHLLPPDDLIRRRRSQGGRFDAGSMMFCGTLPVQGALCSAAGFSMTLRDPVLGRSLSHRYRIVSSSSGFIHEHHQSA